MMGSLWTHNHTEGTKYIEFHQSIEISHWLAVNVVNQDVLDQQGSYFEK